jgi:hypothetical protein
MGIGGSSSSKGGISGIGGGGLSPQDFAFIQQAFGQGSEEITNRYKQLGIGQPSGDPLTAAEQGTSLQYAGPSTAETTDINSLGGLANAALGQLQNQNINNPAISGTPANVIANNQQAGQAINTAGFQAGLASGGGGGGVNTNPTLSS